MLVFSICYNQSLHATARTLNAQFASSPDSETASGKANAFVKCTVVFFVALLDDMFANLLRMQRMIT